MHVVRLARFLGWFSIGLGLMEVFCGRALARKLGMRRHTRLIRAFGMREIANGAAILANPTYAPLLWARVGGDALDLAVLGGTPVFGRRERAHVKLAVAAVVGVTLLDILCATRLSERDDRRLRHTPPYWE